MYHLLSPRKPRSLLFQLLAPASFSTTKELPTAPAFPLIPNCSRPPSSGGCKVLFLSSSCLCRTAGQSRGLPDTPEYGKGAPMDMEPSPWLCPSLQHRAHAPTPRNLAPSFGLPSCAAEGIRSFYWMSALIYSNLQSNNRPHTGSVWQTEKYACSSVNTSVLFVCVCEGRGHSLLHNSSCSWSSGQPPRSSG